jgi:hypothetical protein
MSKVDNFIQERRAVEKQVADYMKIITEKPSAWVGHAKAALTFQFLLKPRVIVDLGVDYGFSTFLWGMLKVGNVYGIDTFGGDEHAGYHSDAYQHVIETQKKLARRFNNNNIHIIKDTFANVSNKGWYRPVDILHIDGQHGYEDVKRDYNDWIRHVTPDGLILFHDTTSFPDDVGRFFNEIESEYKFNYEHSAGLGVLTFSETTWGIINKLF